MEEVDIPVKVYRLHKGLMIGTTGGVSGGHTWGRQQTAPMIVGCRKEERRAPRGEEEKLKEGYQRGHGGDCGGGTESPGGGGGEGARREREGERDEGETASAPSSQTISPAPPPAPPTPSLAVSRASYVIISAHLSSSIPGHSIV